MFGVLRTTLALMVMVYHLFIGWGPLGPYAVFGFYIISGYLMTLIMHEHYGYTWIGRFSFAGNRFLRLYPQYWAATLVSILLIVGLGAEVTTSFHKSIFIPVSLESILQNIFMAFTAWFPNSINPRLVPPTWALTVEMFFYFLICLGVSKTLFRVKIWLFLSVCYVIGSYIMSWDMGSRYFPVAAASLPFSIGAAIYFMTNDALLIQQFTRLRLSSRTIFVVMLFNCLAWLIASRMEIGNLGDVGFYINIVIFALLVYSLVIGGEILSVTRKTDKIIGDYSYPIYLLHWQSGLLASYLIYGEAFHELSDRGLLTLIAAFVIVVLTSSFFIHGVDERVQRIRSKIKANKALQRMLVPRVAEL